MPELDQGTPSMQDLEARIRQKLQSSILPRVYGARRLNKSFAYLVFSFHNATIQISLAIAGLGFSHPMLTLVSGGTTSSGQASQPAALYQSLKDYPFWLVVILSLFILIWFATNVFMHWRQLRDKGPLIRQCFKEMQDVESELLYALSQERPLDGISSLVERSREIVDRYRKLDVYPWVAGPPDLNADRVSEEINQLFDTYRNSWRVAP